MAVPNTPNWQAQILHGLGKPVTAENVKFLNAWAQAEGGNASNNPFNTTQNAPGAVSNYNSVGVKNYSSPAAGLAATIQTLQNGRYGAILNAMAKGNSAMADAAAEATTPWGTGSLIEKVLGGPVTGGTPTTSVPSGATNAQALAGAVLNGQVGAPSADPAQSFISYVMANNNALMNRAQPVGYQPF